MGGPPPPPPTLGVCVMSIASDSKHGCEFLQHVQEGPAHWSIVGIGRWISDAAVAKIQDCGDSHHPHTQATVIGSAGFPELLVYLLGLLRAGYTRFVIVSRLGLFLSDIVGRFLTDAANYAKDPSGWRSTIVPTTMCPCAAAGMNSWNRLTVSKHGQQCRGR